jgi:hypothetical protein
MATSAQLGLFDVPKQSRQLSDICRGKHHGNTRSEEANRLVAPHKKAARDQILELARQRGQRGITLHELCNEMGKLPHQISGRITELKQDGKLFEQSGDGRDGCAVLVARRDWCQVSSKHE